MPTTEIETFCPASREEWRQWLEANHRTKEKVWLVQYKKGSGMPCLSWSESVDEALCFGWIDSVRRPIDALSYMQCFGRRKAKSMWSKINKEKVVRLMADGLMTPAGLESIAIAKQNGSWAILDEAEDDTLPADLDLALSAHAGAKDYILGLSRSVRKVLLQWIVLAKRPETRAKRINEIAEHAGRQQRPPQFR